MYNDKLIKQFEKEMSIEGDSFYAVKQQYIKWLENKVESAMCEANSNAVLAEVLKIIDKKYLKEDGIKNIDFNKIDSVVRECIKIEINKCLNETKKEILSISANKSIHEVHHNISSKGAYTNKC